MVKIAQKHGAKFRASQIEKIILVIGENSGFIGDSIQMYFDIISKGTICEGAVLEMKYIETKVKCPECGEIFKRKPMSFACPVCGANGEPTDIGKEFYIESIEIRKE